MVISLSNWFFDVGGDFGGICALLGTILEASHLSKTQQPVLFKAMPGRWIPSTTSKAWGHTRRHFDESN
jgi:hypothetical protein